MSLQDGPAGLGACPLPGGILMPASQGSAPRGAAAGGGSDSLRILMIAPSCCPPGNPEAFVNCNLVSAMLGAGWCVDVVSGAEGDLNWYPGGGELWSEVAARSHSVRERPRTLPWKALTCLDALLLSGQVTGAGRWAVPAARAALNLARARNYDVVLSRLLPGSAHLAAAIVAGKTGLPWIANWNDPLQFPPPYGIPGERLSPLERRSFRALARQAAWHTFPCERLRDYVCGDLPVEVRERSSVIPHLVPELAAPTRHPCGKFSLLYAGSLRPPRDPRPFLAGVKLFLEQSGARDLELHFVTDRPEEVTGPVAELALGDRTRIEPGRPYQELPRVMQDAEILVIIEADLEEGIFLPSKFVDYIQTGRPVLAVSPREGTLADILSRQGGGVAVDLARPESIASGIAALYRSWQQGRLEAEYGSERLRATFSRQAVLEQYRRLFARLGIGHARR